MSNLYLSKIISLAPFKGGREPWYIFLFLMLFLSAQSWAQTPEIRNNYVDSAGLPHLKIERSMVFTPGENWLYNHHQAIISFKNKFYALWSNGLKDEDSPGQRVVYAISSDFKPFDHKA